MAQDREPDFSRDPRKSGQGSGGYPEDQPAEAGAGQHDRREDEEDRTDAPSQSGGQDSDAETATGNPTSG